MNNNFIPSLIALTGVLFSVLSSFIISIRQSKIETRKLRNEYLHLYARKIFENRLEAYPLIIGHLVKFFQKVNLYKLKKEERYEIKIDELKELFQLLLEWDARNSTLYSAELQNVIHTTYHNLYKLITTPPEKLIPIIKKPGFLKRIRNELFVLYLQLKKDLGIYSFESPSAISNFHSPITVSDLSTLIQKIQKNK